MSPLSMLLRISPRSTRSVFRGHLSHILHSTTTPHQIKLPITPYQSRTDTCSDSRKRQLLRFIHRRLSHLRPSIMSAFKARRSEILHLQRYPRMPPKRILLPEPRQSPTTHERHPRLLPPITARSKTIRSATPHPQTSPKISLKIPSKSTRPQEKPPSIKLDQQRVL